MPSLTPDEQTRLISIMGMLASIFAGKRAAAELLATRLLVVNLLDLKVEEASDGCLLIKPREQQGRRWACYALQPETLASIQAEIGILWARS